MAGLLTVDGGVNIDDAVVPLGEFCDFHGGSVGNLPIEAPQELFPDDLRHDLPLGLVGGDILREEERAFHCVFFADRQQILHTISRLGGNGNNGIEACLLGIDRNHFQQLLLLHGIDLIDGKNRRTVAALDFLQQTLLLGTDGGDGLHHQNGQIHIGNGIPGHIHHIVAQLGAGAMVAGGIHKDKLGVFPGDDAADPVSGGLGFIGNDGDLFADQKVRQGGLAHVGPSGNGNHSGFRFHILSPVIRILQSRCIPGMVAAMASSRARICRFCSPSSIWS